MEGWWLLWIFFNELIIPHALFFSSNCNLGLQVCSCTCMYKDLDLLAYLGYNAMALSCGRFKSLSLCLDHLDCRNLSALVLCLGSICFTWKYFLTVKYFLENAQGTYFLLLPHIISNPNRYNIINKFQPKKKKIQITNSCKRERVGRASCLILTGTFILVGTIKMIKS